MTNGERDVGETRIDSVNHAALPEKRTSSGLRWVLFRPDLYVGGAAPGGWRGIMIMVTLSTCVREGKIATRLDAASEDY